MISLLNVDGISLKAVSSINGDFICVVKSSFIAGFNKLWQFSFGYLLKLFLELKAKEVEKGELEEVEGIVVDDKGKISWLLKFKFVEVFEIELLLFFVKSWSFNVWTEFWRDDDARDC